jgi:hypothetical protein
VTLLVRFGAPDGVIFGHYLIDAQLRLHVAVIHSLSRSSEGLKEFTDQPPVADCDSPTG